MLELFAPAKINLTLEVLGRRNDGYHDILSVVQAISLADSVGLESADSLYFECDQDSWDAEKSLARKAANSFFKFTNTCGAGIHITKRIPLSSGLGGESSLAASVLVGLDRLFNTDLPPGDLLRIASRIGSDVAFFLTGGTALMEDTGTRVTPLPALPHCWVVLLVPEGQSVENKTGRMFSLLTDAHYSFGRISEKMVAQLNRGCNTEEFFLYNAFEQIADQLFTSLAPVRQAFRQAGAIGVHLTGAGPALFSLFTDKEQALRTVENLKSAGMSALLSETLKSSGLKGPAWPG
jgi:4-diphosphocytidyl-2-C-methyl-D-erythritol kinase